MWYVSPPLGATCYFKSTDGHNNNWSFSTVRLNLSTAEAAAAAGGCVIVDATRRGKVGSLRGFVAWAGNAIERMKARQLLAKLFQAASCGLLVRSPPRRACCLTCPSWALPPALQRFPDAMSKTIPMWCAVLNRAVHRLRQQAAAPAAAPHAAAAVAAGAVPGAAPWDCKLHLPPWVSDVERNSIQQRLDGWVDDLFGVCGQGWQRHNHDRQGI